MKGDSIVFVIDHDHSSRTGLTSLLQTARYHVRGFASVNEILDVLNPEVSGCIVIDPSMPGFSGEELMEELNGRGVNLPIIVVSCTDDKESVRNAEKMKAIAFFRKPVDGTALIDAINWALRVHDTDNSKLPKNAKS